MPSPNKASTEPPNHSSALLRQWRNRKITLPFSFVPYLASIAIRSRRESAAEAKIHLPLKRIVMAGIRRIWRYVRFTTWPTEFVAYQYSQYGSVSAIRWRQKLPRADQEAIRARLEGTAAELDAVQITLVGASRKLGNPNHRLESFCHSLVRTTSNLKGIEVVVRIDDDDDLLHYLAIKEHFDPCIAMRFVVGSRKGGYKGLHTLVSDCLPHLAGNSELVFGFADDCKMVRHGWDDTLLALSRRHPDNIMFINTLRDIELPYDERQVFFWLLWCWGPPSLFTAVGRKALEITARVAKDYSGWTAYGNSVMCDSFFEALQYYVWLETGERRAPVAANTITMRHDILVPLHKEGGLLSQSPVAFRCYREFLSEDTQCVIREMASAIVKEMQISPLVHHDGDTHLLGAAAK